jgi:hypothetical protein
MTRKQLHLDLTEEMMDDRIFNMMGELLKGTEHAMLFNRSDDEITPEQERYIEENFDELYWKARDRIRIENERALASMPVPRMTSGYPPGR